MGTFDIATCQTQSRSNKSANRSKSATLAAQFRAAGAELIPDLADLVAVECRLEGSFSPPRIQCICRALDSIGVLVLASKVRIVAETAQQVDEALMASAATDNADIVASFVQALERIGDQSYWPGTIIRAMARLDPQCPLKTNGRETRTQRGVSC